MLSYDIEVFDKNFNKILDGNVGLVPRKDEQIELLDDKFGTRVFKVVQVTHQINVKFGKTNITYIIHVKQIN